MTIKQKICAIPFIAILIFTIGTVVSYTFSSHSYDLLQRTSNVDHPYLRNVQLLSSQLKSMQENSRPPSLPMTSTQSPWRATKRKTFMTLRSISPHSMAKKRFLKP